MILREGRRVVRQRVCLTMGRLESHLLLEHGKLIHELVLTILMSCSRVVDANVLQSLYTCMSSHHLLVERSGLHHLRLGVARHAKVIRHHGCRSMGLVLLRATLADQDLILILVMGSRGDRLLMTL